MVRFHVAATVHSEPKSASHGRQVSELIKRRLATGAIRHANSVVLTTHNISPRIGMSPEPTEEEMRRVLFGADEPIAQENAPPVQKASHGCRNRAVDEGGREK